MDTTHFASRWKRYRTRWTTSGSSKRTVASASGTWSWRGFPDEDLEAASDHYRERGSREDVEATVAVFGDETNLLRETQEYMGEAWSRNGRYTGVDKVGFVSDGITAMAVCSKMEIPGAEIDHFDDLDDALAWARD